MFWKVEEEVKKRVKYITSDEIETFMNKIYTIDKIDDIDLLTNLGLLNKIKNIETFCCNTVPTFS